MAITDESILKQLRKLKVCFLKYYPVRVKKNIGIEQQLARQMVWDFKDGKNFEQVAVRVATELKSQFSDKVTEIVFCCVPASSAEKNEIRYKEFSRMVCELSGAMNGYPHISVQGNRLAVHEHNAEKSITMVQVVDFDEPFFVNKNCLVFDDVITRGISFGNFANKLETFGANVLGGFFLGKTTYKVS
ncbi:MAG: phosphoribosyltransferase [Bacteroidaceae bacterium]|nr:phosphoribosyltransferase [Bacteroidaceae bacterium]